MAASVWLDELVFARELIAFRVDPVIETSSTAVQKQQGIGLAA